MYKKYDIVIADLNPTQWSEQWGNRPCIIIQNNRANVSSRTFVIAPIFSVIKKYPHTVIVDPTKKNWLNVQSRIDLLQVRALANARITKKIGTLDKSDYVALNKAIRIAFDV